MHRTPRTSVTVGSLVLAMSGVMNAHAAEVRTVQLAALNDISGQCGGLFGGDRGDLSVHNHVQDTVTMTGNTGLQPKGATASKNNCSAPAKQVNAAPAKPVNTATPAGKPR